MREQAALNGDARVDRDGRAGEDGADEARAGAERGRRIDDPVDVAGGGGAGEDDGRGGAGRERGADLEDVEAAAGQSKFAVEADRAVEGV